MQNNCLKLEVKNLFAKAVNHGMTTEQDYKVFQDSIRDVTGSKFPKQ